MHAEQELLFVKGGSCRFAQKVLYLRKFRICHSGAVIRGIPVKKFLICQSLFDLRDFLCACVLRKESVEKKSDVSALPVRQDVVSDFRKCFSDSEVSGHLRLEGIGAIGVDRVDVAFDERLSHVPKGDDRSQFYLEAKSEIMKLGRNRASVDLMKARCAELMPVWTELCARVSVVHEVVVVVVRNVFVLGAASVEGNAGLFCARILAKVLVDLLLLISHIPRGHDRGR